MTSTEKPSVNLHEHGAVSPAGFRIENAAGVAIENCLNEGVHPNRLRGLLWVDWLKTAGTGGLPQGSPGMRDTALGITTEQYRATPD